MLVVCPVDGARSGSAGWGGVEVLRHPAVVRSMRQTTVLAKGMSGANCWAVGCSSSEDRAPFYDLPTWTRDKNTTYAGPTVPYYKGGEEVGSGRIQAVRRET